MIKGKILKTYDVERAIIDLEIEKSKINREKSLLVLNKALLLYFTFLFLSILGLVYGYIGKYLFNVLIIMGLLVLIIGIIPYVKTMQAEETNIDRLIANLKHSQEVRK